VRLCSCQVALLHRGPGGMENALLMCETEFIKGVGLVVKAREREGGREGYVREGSGGREGKEGRKERRRGARLSAAPAHLESRPFILEH
jgi:hypothetical protein